MTVNYEKRGNKFYRTDGKRERGRDCVACGCSCKHEHQGLFKDQISFREFQISGLCQGCQDDVFGVPELDLDDLEIVDTEESGDENV